VRLSPWGETTSRPTCFSTTSFKRAATLGPAHRAKLDNNAALAKFANSLEKVCIDTVVASYMTKDLALLVGPDQKWLSTTGFLNKVDENL
jgi:isocitrate dehydrogenase